MFVPAGTGAVVDHWDTMGLRGTGSHDLVLDDVVVPEAHTFVVGGATNRHDAPYARLDIWNLVHLGVAAFPLGVARRALDEFADRARAKTRGMARPWSVAEDGEVQADVGRATTELAAARAFVDTAARRLWDAVVTGDDDPAAGQELAMATAHGLRAALRVVDSVFGHAVAGHVFYSAGTDREIGRRLLLPDQA